MSEHLYKIHMPRHKCLTCVHAIPPSPPYPPLPLPLSFHQATYLLLIATYSAAPETDPYKSTRIFVNASPWVSRLQPSTSNIGVVFAYLPATQTLFGAIHHCRISTTGFRWSWGNVSPILLTESVRIQYHCGTRFKKLPFIVSECCRSLLKESQNY